MRRFLTITIIMCLLLGSFSSIAMGINLDEQRAVDLINQERTARGLNPLIISQALMDSSEEFCSHVVNHSPITEQNVNLYCNETHIDYDTGLSPDKRIEKYAPNFSEEGENMAIIFTVEQAHTAFMNSPGHRENILNSSYRYVGVSVKPLILDGKPNIFIVEDFMNCGSFPKRLEWHKGHKRQTVRHAHIYRRLRQRKIRHWHVN